MVLNPIDPRLQVTGPTFVPFVTCTRRLSRMAAVEAANNRLHEDCVSQGFQEKVSRACPAGAKPKGEMLKDFPKAEP
jgi:hypothetical protein